MFKMDPARRRLDWLLPSWLEDVDAFSQTSDEDLIDVAYTILVNLCLLAVCVVVCAILRQKNPEMFIPKRYVAPDRTPANNIPNNTWFGWLIDLYYLSDELLIDKGGYDAYILIRFYKLCFKILFISSFYCLLILLPLDGYVKHIFLFCFFPHLAE